MRYTRSGIPGYLNQPDDSEAYTLLELASTIICSETSKLYITVEGLDCNPAFLVSKKSTATFDALEMNYTIFLFSNMKVAKEYMMCLDKRYGYTTSKGNKGMYTFKCKESRCPFCVVTSPQHMIYSDRELLLVNPSCYVTSFVAHNHLYNANDRNRVDDKYRQRLELEKELFESEVKNWK